MGREGFFFSFSLGQLEEFKFFLLKKEEGGEGGSVDGENSDGIAYKSYPERLLKSNRIEN